MRRTTKDRLINEHADTGRVSPKRTKALRKATIKENIRNARKK